MAHHGKTPTPEQWDAASAPLFDETNPLALVNVAPKEMVPHIQRVRDELPITTFSADEKDLRRRIDPSERDDRIRISFWDEYNFSTSIGKRMALRRILVGGCNYETWETVYLRDNKKLLWILTPPANYAAAMRSILAHGISRLEEIIRLPIVNPRTGEINTKVITQILKAVQLVDLRVKGAIMQRVQIDQRSLNINADMPREQLQAQQIKELSSMSLEQLEQMEKKLEKVERLERKMIANLPEDAKQEVIDFKADLEAEKVNLGTYNPELPVDDPDDVVLDG